MLRSTAELIAEVRRYPGVVLSVKGHALAVQGIGTLPTDLQADVRERAAEIARFLANPPAWQPKLEFPNEA